MNSGIKIQELKYFGTWNNKKEQVHTKSRMVSFRAFRSGGCGELCSCEQYDTLKFKYFCDFKMLQIEV